MRIKILMRMDESCIWKDADWQFTSRKSTDRLKEGLDHCGCSAALSTFARYCWSWRPLQILLCFDRAHNEYFIHIQLDWPFLICIIMWLWYGSSARRDSDKILQSTQTLRRKLRGQIVDFGCAELQRLMQVAPRLAARFCQIHLVILDTHIRCRLPVHKPYVPVCTIWRRNASCKKRRHGEAQSLVNMGIWEAGNFPHQVNREKQIKLEGFAMLYPKYTHYWPIVQ